MNGTRLVPIELLDDRALARFSGKHRAADSGCWIWTAASNPKGYGVFGLGPAATNQMFYAHRVAYTIHVGPIPEGMVIDHLCRVTSCVNPAHLEAVTPDENHRRQMLAVTHCPRGHEYTAENTYVRAGARFCRECNRLSKRRSRNGLPSPTDE